TQLSPKPGYRSFCAIHLLLWVAGWFSGVDSRPALQGRFVQNSLICCVTLCRFKTASLSPFVSGRDRLS
ncbi:unnamed protein product, partial [Bubo scandiacus]